MIASAHAPVIKAIRHIATLPSKMLLCNDSATEMSLRKGGRFRLPAEELLDPVHCFITTTRVRPWKRPSLLMCVTYRKRGRSFAAELHRDACGCAGGRRGR